LERNPERLFLEHLESRRGELAVAMWQAPTLTFTAQAFLLIVLTNDDVSTSARLAVLVAGVMATLVAIFALLRLRQREVLYSEAIAFYADKLKMPDPRPHALAEGGRIPVQNEGRLDKWLREKARHEHFPTLHLSWVVALALFILADVVAFVCAGR
jgi:hypothetical protein